MNASAWVDGLLRKIFRRFSPPEWPKVGTDEWVDFRDDWVYALDGHRITEAEADEALQRLRQDPPQWLREHLPKFVAAVDRIRKEKSATAEASDMERAKAASRGCTYCGGAGMRGVYDPGFDGRYVVIREVSEFGEVKQARYAMVVNAHCTCAMGRWMRGAVRDVTILNRIPDLADVIAGRSRFQLADPNGEESGAYYRRQPARGGGVVKV